ncbi:MAG: UTP--glucose-1-phosphate uridylyltransferase, partial [Pirellulales bacterium]
MPHSDIAAMREHLASYDQEHVLQFWDQLEPLEQQALARQVEQIDLQLIQDLYRSVDESPRDSGESSGDRNGQDWESLARRALPPQALRLAEWSDGSDSSCKGVSSSNGASNAGPLLGCTQTAARERGMEALRAGKVGVLLVAGGQGTRLGFELPKSLFPIGPQSESTLLQIHVEKVRAASQRYGVSIPLYLMTSPATHEATVQFLQQHDRLGLDESQLFVFCQGLMPAVDIQTGKLLMSDVGEVFMSPDGHGGTIAALAASGAIDHMDDHGIEQLFYLQVDNPLAPVGDPDLIGAHLLSDSEMTSLAIAKSGPLDRLGNFVMLDHRLQIIEYSDFPTDVAERCNDSGELVFWAGSVAIHVFQVEFLRRSLALKEA